MIEQNAVVLKVEGQMALVEAQRQSSCGACNAKKGCGTGMLENSLGRRAMQMKAVNQCDAQPGDEVVVAVPEKGFIKTAFFTYLLPLLLMLVGALVSQRLSQGWIWANQDIAALVGAGIGFIVALLVLRGYSQKMENDEQMQPVVIRKIKPPIMVNISQLPKEQHPF